MNVIALPTNLRRVEEAPVAVPGLRADLERVLRHSWMLDGILAPTRHSIVLAETQYGKTDCIAQVIAWVQNLCNGTWLTPIVILRNSVEDWGQLADRMGGMEDDLIRMFRGRDTEAELRLGQPELITALNDRGIRSVMRNRGGRFLALIANHVHLEKLVRFLSGPDYDPETCGRILLIVDEADTMMAEVVGEGAGADPRRTRCEKALRKILELSACSLSVSATAVSLLAAEKMTSVVRLDVPVDARGMTYHSFEDHTYCAASLDGLVKAPAGSPAHDAALRELDRVMLAEEVAVVPGVGRPMPVRGFLRDEAGMMLVVPGQETRSHHLVRTILQDRYGGRNAPTIVVHNETAIRVWAHRGRRWQEVANFPASSSRRRDGAKIADVLRTLREERDANPSAHRHIVVIAGKKAGRGITYASACNRLRITHAVVLAPAEAGGQDLIQVFGRATGRVAAAERRVVIGSAALLDRYVGHCLAQRDVFESLREASPSVIEGPTGLVMEMSAQAYSVVLQQPVPNMRFATPRIEARTGAILSFLDAAKDRAGQRKFTRLSSALTAHPEVPVYDVMLELNGHLAPEWLDVLHDVRYLRGPATPGAPVQEHIRALKAARGARGRGSRYGDLLRALGAAAERSFDALRAAHGDDPRLVWSPFVERGADWSKADLAIRHDHMTMPGITKGVPIRRNATHLSLTKERKLDSQGGDIEWCLTHFVMSWRNETRQERDANAGLPFHEQGPRNPAAPLGIVMRMAEPGVGIKRILPDGTMDELTEAQAAEIMGIHRKAYATWKKAARADGRLAAGKDKGPEAPVVRRYVRGPYIVCTTERQWIVRGEMGGVPDGNGLVVVNRGPRDT